ncbi:histamine N-methyltransferase-like isoform 2-T3 [Clarias gariepinus]|uniref:histamine N-methyltransferase-like isoform X2 n=1 Tax=Clarias gariepinus TaxID=13013 RepID=UPI00234D312F|nr:histamine N-methyltransferase-like isoform X2 [Clarias gariepinus]
MERQLNDDSAYLQSFELFLENSTEHKSIKNFIYTTLPDILARIGAGEPTLNVMGVGSGSGEIDLEILKVLHEKHPDVKVENEVVEPSNAMLNKYRALLTETPALKDDTFTWNKMTATEFQGEWKKKNSDKKMHLISMIQLQKNDAVLCEGSRGHSFLLPEFTAQKWQNPCNSAHKRKCMGQTNECLQRSAGPGRSYHACYNYRCQELSGFQNNSLPKLQVRVPVGHHRVFHNGR